MSDFEVCPIGTQARLAAVEAERDALLADFEMCQAGTLARLAAVEAERDALQNKADRAEQCASYEAQRADKAEAERDALLEALRVFVSCAYPVSTEIDERGHRWSEAYLDQALLTARAAIAKAGGGNG